MKNNIITTQRAGINDELVHIIFEEGAELPSLLPQVEQVFFECIRNKDVKIIANMANIKLPPTKFIALLIEVTNQARRLGGDIKLINISNFAKSNLVTFSAVTYLSILDSMEFALYDFDEKITIVDLEKEKPVKPKPATIQEKSNLINNRPEKNLDNFDFENLIEQKTIKVTSKVESLYEICDFVINLADKAGFDQREIGKIKVTVYEACLNVIEHAYFSNPDNWLEVTVGYDNDKLIIIIHDWGQGFDYHPNKDYDVERAVKDRKTGGFGMHIIQRSVDKIYYDADPKIGNRLTLIKYLDSVNTSVNN